MTCLIISGTNTDVGKTAVTAALAAAAKARGIVVHMCKPVQTGDDADASVVQAATGVPVHEFYRFPEPLAPNLAARRAGMAQPEIGELCKRIRDIDRPGRLVLVEGAGGLLVRLADDFTLADVAVELAAPLIVVTSVGLGSLNAAELTVEAARRRGIDVVGVVGGAFPGQPDLPTALNVDEFSQVTRVPYLGHLEHGTRDPHVDFDAVFAAVSL